MKGRSDSENKEPTDLETISKDKEGMLRKMCWICYVMFLYLYLCIILFFYLYDMRALGCHLLCSCCAPLSNIDAKAAEQTCCITIISSSLFHPHVYCRNITRAFYIYAHMYIACMLYTEPEVNS